jgi:hypothetical protein
MYWKIYVTLGFDSSSHFSENENIYNYTISLNIPEREINLHFVNYAGLQQNAPFCVLKKRKKNHGFIILYLKF